MRTNRSFPNTVQREPPPQGVLQAAYRARSFYHRRVQRRTSAGCARYSTASGAQRRAIRVEPWNAFEFFRALHPVWYCGV